MVWRRIGGFEQAQGLGGLSDLQECAPQHAGRAPVLPGGLPVLCSGSADAVVLGCKTTRHARPFDLDEAFARAGLCPLLRGGVPVAGQVVECAQIDGTQRVVGFVEEGTGQRVVPCFVGADAGVEQGFPTSPFAPKAAEGRHRRDEVGCREHVERGRVVETEHEVVLHLGLLVGEVFAE